MRSKRGDSGAHGAVLLTLGIIIMTSTIGGFVAFNVARSSSAMYATSTEKLNQMTTSLKVLELIAQKSAPRELSYIYELVELGPDARKGISLRDVSIVLNTPLETTVYDYSTRINCSLNPAVDTSIYSISNPLNAGLFGANSRVNTNTPQKYDGYLTRHNIVRLCFATPRGLTEDEEITVKVVADDARPLETKVTLPTVFVSDFVRLLEHVA